MANKTELELKALNKKFRTVECLLATTDYDQTEARDSYEEQKGRLEEEIAVLCTRGLKTLGSFRLELTRLG